MANYLLDSDVIIDALNGKRGRATLIERLLLDGHSLACCAISITEVYAGLRSEERAQTREFLLGLNFHAITWEIARRAGLLKRHWSRKGITLAVTDVTIAAVALERDLSLITGNRKHYPMPELQLYPLPEEA